MIVLEVRFIIKLVYLTFTYADNTKTQTISVMYITRIRYTYVYDMKTTNNNEF